MISSKNSKQHVLCVSEKLVNLFQIEWTRNQMPKWKVTKRQTGFESEVENAYRHLICTPAFKASWDVDFWSEFCVASLNTRRLMLRSCDKNKWFWGRNLSTRARVSCCVNGPFKVPTIVWERSWPLLHIWAEYIKGFVHYYLAVLLGTSCY